MIGRLGQKRRKLLGSYSAFATEPTYPYITFICARRVEMRLNKSYALRFIKLPPANLVLGRQFEIAFSLTDDLGLELPGYPGLKISLSFEALEDAISPSSYLVQEAASGFSYTQISSSRSLIHKRTLKLVDTKGHEGEIGPLVSGFLGLHLEGQEQAVNASRQAIHSADEHLLKYTQEMCTLYMPDEDIHALVLSTRAGPISVQEPSKRVLPPIGDKVTKTEVHVSQAPRIRVVERPMDRIIGDHLWHSSLVLASAIDAKTIQVPEVDAIVEIGSGCGLVALAIAGSIGAAHTQLIATDLEEVVESTLRECLSINDAGSLIQPFVLEWANEEHISNLLARLAGLQSIWLVAADVLYNTESHSAFLETIRRLATSFARCQVTIAYRPRAYCDDAFFDLSKNDADMPFERIWSCADVQIWQHGG